MAQGRMLKKRYKKKPIPFHLKREIHIRDNFTCQICGKKGRRERSFAYEIIGSVDWDGNIPNRVRFEIDHIIPEYIGGLNTKDNLQLACRKCNRGKGYRNGS